MFYAATISQEVPVVTLVTIIIKDAIIQAIFNSTKDAFLLCDIEKISILALKAFVGEKGLISELVIFAIFVRAHTVKSIC